MRGIRDMAWGRTCQHRARPEAVLLVPQRVSQAGSSRKNTWPRRRVEGVEKYFLTLIHHFSNAAVINTALSAPMPH